MPITSGNEWFNEALNFAPKQILPLVCFGDGSSFSAAIQTRVQALAGQALAPIILHADYATAGEKCEELFDADYPRRIDPLKLWRGQPAWCAWFGTGDEKTVSAYLENRRKLARTPTRAYQHFLFLKVNDLGLFQKTIAHKLEETEQFLFLVSEKAAINRTEAILAEGSAVYMFLSWTRYCEAGTGKLRDALDLTGRESVFTLGIGKDLPDYDFFIPDWTARLTASLCREWIKKTGMTEIPDYQSHKDILRVIAPDETYLVKPVIKLEYPAISFPDSTDSFHIEFIEDVHTPGFSAKATLQDWAKRIALLRKLDEFLRFLILPSTETVIQSRLTDFPVEFERRFRQFLKIKPEPAGLLEDLRQRIKVSRDYLAQTSDAEVLEPAGMRSLEANIGLLTKRVMNISPVAGALLRLALIAVGLVWLFIGAFVWGNTNPFNDQVLRWIAVGSASALFVLTGIVFFRWYLIRRSAERSEQLARQDIKNAHIVEVAQIMVRGLKAQCQTLVAKLDDLEAARRTLEDAVRAGLVPETATTRTNRNPRFRKEAFDLLFQQNLSEMLKAAHTAIRQSLESVDWPDFDKERWSELVKTHAGNVVKNTLEQLTFDQCVKAADFTEKEKERAVHDVVSEARKPALLVGEDFNSPVWLLAAAEWRLCTGSHDEATIQPLQLNCLMALSPVPVVLMEARG
jgi:hypothetical protein